MDKLRQLGALCRDHYEKLALTAALLILAGAIFFLNNARVEEQDKIQAIPGDFKTRKVKPVQAVDLAPATEALQRAEKPPVLSSSGNHNLFNPVEWRLDRASQTPLKIKSEKDVGPLAMQIVQVVPLHLQVVYGSATTSGSEDQLVVLGYMTYSTNETVGVRSVNPPRVVRAVVNPSETNKQAVFILREAKGDVTKPSDLPREPSELIAELKDFGGERFSFGPGKPYSRVLTYEAELRYKPNPDKKYTAIRTNSPVDIEGQIYKVVDITPQRVVLSDDSNGKQYSITAIAQ
jgi:hypothetical protein